MGDPRFQQPSLIAKRLDNAASKRPTLWSSKGNLCKPSGMHPLRLRHAEQSRRSVPRLQPSGTDAPFCWPGTGFVPSVHALPGSLGAIVAHSVRL